MTMTTTTHTHCETTKNKQKKERIKIETTSNVKNSSTTLPAAAAATATETNFGAPAAHSCSVDSKLTASENALHRTLKIYRFIQSVSLALAGHSSMLCASALSPYKYDSIVFISERWWWRATTSFRFSCTDCTRTTERTKWTTAKKESTLFFASLYFIASLLWVHMFGCLGFVTRAQPFTNQEHSVCAHVYQRAIDFSFAEFFYIYSSQFQFDFDFRLKCYTVRYLLFVRSFIFFSLSTLLFFCSVSLSVQFEIVVQFRDTLHEPPNWCETCKSN